MKHGSLHAHPANPKWIDLDYETKMQENHLFDHETKQENQNNISMTSRTLA
jgi:hypothetical protein